MLDMLFWLALFVGLYPYVIYPFIVRLVAAVKRSTIRKDPAHMPFVTVITAAYNEAQHIEATVRNKLAQDYPADRLNILVVSDESTDGTDEIVAAIASQHPRVRLLRQQPRAGKTAALNLAVPDARGEILVFADANSLYRPEAIRKLMSNFADPTVGYVSGQMLYIDAHGSLVGDGCSAYMRYENMLRDAETQIGSIVGVDGGIDAARRMLYRPMRPDQLPDFILPLSIIEQGYRVVYEPEAILTEDSLSTGGSEYRMRVRVALRALWALWDKRSLLNPFRSGLFAWQLWSHKVLRYLGFLPLSVAMMLNWMLLDHGVIYMVAAAGQFLFAAQTVAALIGPRFVRQSTLGRYCVYFALLNVASVVAVARFLRGHKQVLWQPRVG
jgi:cellulose synthase/poly-beta-1,6-N-acetylglucosamine synthase-like glycosyltransferase